MLAAPLLLAFEFLRRHPDRMILCYLIAAVLLGVVTIGKESAFIQYFYESLLIVSALVPALLVSRLGPRTPPIEVVLLLGVGLVAGQLYTPPAPSAAAFTQNAALQSFFRQSYPAGSRALGFREGDLLLAEFDTPFADLFQTELLSKRGVVPDGELIERIRGRWFSVIVLDFDLQTERDQFRLDFYLNEPIRRAIAENYEISATMPTPSPEKLWEQDQFYIYVPRAQAAANRDKENVQ
jgi:hypothetical protein